MGPLADPKCRSVDWSCFARGHAEGYNATQHVPALRTSSERSEGRVEQGQLGPSGGSTPDV